MSAPVLIAGAGPGGLVAALALTRRGVPVVVLERQPVLGVAGAGLTLQINAMRMLASLDLADAVIAAGAPVSAARLERASGTLIQATSFDPLRDRFGVPGVGILRSRLADLLLDALRASAPDVLRLGAQVTDVHQDDNGVTAILSTGEAVRGSALIGADGLHSAVRRAILGPIAPRSAGYTAWRGIAAVPAVVGDVVTTERWGDGRRFGWVPIGPSGVYWFATLDAPPGGVDGPDVLADLRRTHADFAEPVGALLDATPPDLVLRNDIVDLPILRRWTIGRVTLLGDAAHAMTPNLGQGACQAIEDAVVLASHLTRTPDVPRALADYEAQRRPRAAAIVRQSDRVGRIGQWSGVRGRLRDAAFTCLPSAVMARQLVGLYDVEVPG